VVFRDVAREAPVVVLARPAAGGPERREVELERVVKGRCERRRFILPEEIPGERPLRDGDLVLLALDRKLAPVRVLRSLGFCKPISILVLRGGKLRGTARADYDNGRGRLTLEAVIADLETLTDERSAR
jgi:hypothetical protein